MNDNLVTKPIFLYFFLFLSSKHNVLDATNDFFSIICTKLMIFLSIFMPDNEKIHFILQKMLNIFQGLPRFSMKPMLISLIGSKNINKPNFACIFLHVLIK